MPEVSRFLGIVILMYFDEHNPPHFHVRYQRYEAAIDIRTLGVMQGTLPPRIHGLVIKWAGLHQHKLLENWNRCRHETQPDKIPPL